MILVFILQIICHFFLSGMLTSEIFVSKLEGRKISWILWTFAPICFLFGIYNLIALVGYISKC
jgi:hypothetical protein